MLFVNEKLPLSSMLPFVSTAQLDKCSATLVDVST